MPNPNPTQSAAGATQAGPYYVTSNGARRYFAEIADRIAEKQPAMIGKHIFAQLDALGADMRAEFDASESPHALPFSFSEYATAEFPPLEFYGEPGEKELCLGPIGGGVAVADMVTTTGEGRFTAETAAASVKWGRLFIAAPMLLRALDRLQANPNDPRAHREALDALKAARKA